MIKYEGKLFKSGAHLARYRFGVIAMRMYAVCDAKHLAVVYLLSLLDRPLSSLYDLEEDHPRREALACARLTGDDRHVFALALQLWDGEAVELEDCPWHYSGYLLYMLEGIRVRYGYA